jgi:uncharacterized protein (DUF697 family)
MLKGGPLGAVGTARSFMNVVKDIDFEETRNRAEQVPQILVLATSTERVQKAADLLFGDDDRNGVVARPWEDTQSEFDPTRFDVVIVYDPDGTGLFDSVRKAAQNRRDTTNVFFLPENLSKGADPVREVRFEILELLPDLAPAFGRAHPAWRKAAVNAIVEQTARANAQFALVSNIPAIIPLLGGLISASADLLVLTKNQVMMCYKIAAAHGENLDNHLAIVRELSPVVGAGFLWRTAAREAAAFIPFAAGTVPKVAIAFAGTLTMGKAADFYYEHGSKPSRSQMESIRLQAVDLAEKLPIIKQFVGDDKEQSTAPIGSANASISETTIIDVEPKEKEQAG